MNTLMLMLAVRMGGGRIRMARVLLGALAGAAAAHGARCVALGRGQSMLLWLPIAAAMMRIAQGKAVKGRMIREALLLLCAAGFVGGMVLCFSGALQSLGLAYALGAAAACGIGLYALRTRRTAQSVVRAEMTVIYRGQQADFEAMIDSGNTLRDYLTHLPVIVLPKAAAAQTLTIKDMPLRPIFAETAGGRQRMSVLAPQKIELQCQGIRRRVNAVIALSPQMGVNVPALVPAALLDEQGN